MMESNIRGNISQPADTVCAIVALIPNLHDFLLREGRQQWDCYTYHKTSCIAFFFQEPVIIVGWARPRFPYLAATREHKEKNMSDQIRSGAPCVLVRSWITMIDNWRLSGPRKHDFYLYRGGHYGFVKNLDIEQALSTALHEKGLRRLGVWALVVMPQPSKEDWNE